MNCSTHWHVHTCKCRFRFIFCRIWSGVFPMEVGGGILLPTERRGTSRLRKLTAAAVVRRVKAAARLRIPDGANMR